MVSYQTFTKLAFDEARAKGAQFQNIDDGGDFVTQIAEVWNADKDRLKQMTEKQARNYLSERVEA